MGRPILGLTLQFITGFNNLAYHTFNKRECDSDICRLCLEESEQAFHLAFDCPATVSRRLDCFGTADPRLSWSPSTLRKFIEFPEIEEILLTRP